MTLTNLPKNWKLMKAEEICSNEKNAIKAGPFGSSLKKEFYVEKGYKIYGQEQVIRDDFEYGNYYISEERYEKLKNCKIENGDILISLVGTYGRISIVPEEFEPGIINPRLMKISLNQDIVMPVYFKYLLLSNRMKQMIDYLSHGGTMGILNVKIIKQLKFPIPPIETQKKIVETLEKAEKLKEWRAEADELIDEHLKSVFHEMFGDPINNPHNFKVGKIKDLVTKTQYGTSSKANEENKGYPILRMNNINYYGKWDFSSLKHIELDEKDREKYLVYNGELLFNRTNSKELVGKAAVFRRDKPMAFAGYLVKLFTDSPATSEYIAAHLNSPYGKAFLFNMAKSIVGMANINAKEVQRIPILIPPTELREQYAGIVKRHEDLREMQSQSKQEIDNLFNTLMQKTFKGELVC